jgi:FkbM family methyltransferase
MKLPWNISFFLEWLPRMTINSAVKLRRHSLTEPIAGDILTLNMRQPIRGPIALRAVGSDILTFHEVVSDQVYKSVLSYLSDCRTMVDLGANIGLASRYVATHFPTCQIVAVEPNPDTFELLRRNLTNLPNVQLLEAAVWASETQLSGLSDPDHFSAFAVHADNKGTMRGVPISTILEMCKEERVDLLKVDIEGAETELFKGNLDWLDRIGCIAIEFHNNSRNESNFDEIMAQHGFQVIEGKHTVIAIRR